MTDANTQNPENRAPSVVPPESECDPVETARSKRLEAEGVTRAKLNLPSFLLAAALLTLGLALWLLSDVLLMGFGAILIGIGFYRTARLISGRSPVPHKPAVLGVVVLMGGLIYLLAMNAGTHIVAQSNDLIRRLPEAWSQITQTLRGNELGEMILAQIESASPSGDLAQEGATGPMAAAEAARQQPTATQGDANLAAPAANSAGGILSFMRATLSAITGSVLNMVVILTIAIFLALDPKPYIQGSLRLVPIRHRDRAAVITSELGEKLWKWLIGQGLDMLAVAVLTGAGLWLLGIPLALILGIIAGLTNIIPFIGPFISAAPAMAMAFTQSPSDALYVGLLFLAVQQLEGNLLLPMIQKHTANLPPVLTILGVVGFGALFGLPGVIMATPLMLVALILVQRIYVEDILGDRLD